MNIFLMPSFFLPPPPNVSRAPGGFLQRQVGWQKRIANPPVPVVRRRVTDPGSPLPSRKGTPFSLGRHPTVGLRFPHSRGPLRTSRCTYACRKVTASHIFAATIMSLSECGKPRAGRRSLVLLGNLQTAPRPSHALPSLAHSSAVRNRQVCVLCLKQLED